MLSKALLRKYGRGLNRIMSTNYTRPHAAVLKYFKSLLHHAQVRFAKPREAIDFWGRFMEPFYCSGWGRYVYEALSDEVEDGVKDRIDTFEECGELLSLISNAHTDLQTLSFENDPSGWNGDYACAGAKGRAVTRVELMLYDVLMERRRGTRRLLDQFEKGSLVFQEAA